MRAPTNMLRGNPVALRHDANHLHARVGQGHEFAQTHSEQAGAEEMAERLPEPEIDRERPCGKKFRQADVCALRRAPADAHDASL